MNSKIKFYQSIHFKIALVFALMLMLTLEVVGAVFVRQLEHQELANFKQQIELPSYIDNSLATQLTSTDTKTANKEIKTILARVNNTSITEIRVVDAKGIIRGTSSSGNQGIVGQKATDTVIKNTLVNNRSHTENLYDSANHNRYYVSVVPLLASGNANNVVGVVYMRANLEGVYSTVNSISLIYLSAALITIVLGLGLAVLISREITRESKTPVVVLTTGAFFG